MKVVIKKRGYLWWKKFHFNCVADNGNILCRSRKENSIDEIFVMLERLKKFFASGVGLDIEFERNGDIEQPWHFRVVNNYNEDEEVLIWSEQYHNRVDCVKAVTHIKKHIANARTIFP